MNTELTTRQYRSNLEIFGGDGYIGVIYSDNIEKRSDVPTIADLREKFQLTWKLARELKLEIKSWMSGVRNNW